MRNRIISYLALLFICLSLSGCFSWTVDDSIKNVPITSPSEPILPLSKTTAQNVTLLLPLQGPLGSAGQAIRDGFITAYNSDTSGKKPAHINTIDTSNENIVDTYNKAVKAGADFIIGPLAKPDVQTLAQANNISVPTLALNYLDTSTTTPSLFYQFGLSPIDEARQAAALAHQDGKQNAAIIVPNSAWGQTVAQAFQDEWTTLGGKITVKVLFSDDNEKLNQQIQKLANNYKQKFDVILLAASPQLARQIRPLLKFYYVGDVPVYATSLVYTGTPQPGFDLDLNGVTFCDIPWILTNDSAALQLRQRIALFWPGNFQQNARLYALGIDAYKLIKNFPQLTASAQKTINAATGNLYINSDRRVVRQLVCAQFQKGIPSVLGSNVTPNIPSNLIKDNNTANAATNVNDDSATNDAITSSDDDTISADDTAVDDNASN